MRVVVVGGGTPGLVAAHVLRAAGARVRVLEDGPLGDHDIPTPPERTDALVSLLNDLGVPYSSWTPQPGILLRGEVRAYPGALARMRAEELCRIQADIHIKETRTPPPDWTRDTLAPEPRPARAIRFDAGELATAISRRIDVTRTAAAQVEGKVVVDTHGNRHPADAVMWTRPLWEARQRVSWYIPEAVVTQRHLVLVKPRRNMLAQWDWVHTPYTPAGAVHRVTSLGGLYAAEIHGRFRATDATSDLQFIFPQGYAIRHTVHALSGCMLPLSQAPEWPAHVVPLGPYAEWTPKATTDVVLDAARRIAAHWLGARYGQD